MEIKQETLIDKLRDKTSDQLLHMRAEGDMLADEWHVLIETVLRERGEVIPDMPTQPIFIERERKSTKGDVLVCALIGGASIVVSKMIAHSEIGLIISLLCVGYLFIKHMRNSTLLPEQLAEEQAVEEANRLGLNELMKCAADGNVVRVQELLAFRAMNVNARSATGSTALFYAARNGHTEIIELLLQAGADSSIKNDKGATAADIAHKFGHAESATRFATHS